MELSTLRYFLAVAREENMTNAAAALHLSQPALSYQIARLEEELGTELFVRSGRKIRLSEDGLRFLSRAEEIVSMSERAVREIRQDQEGIYGDVYIGAAEARSMTFFARVIADIRKENPHIAFHFTSGNMDDVHEKLSQGVLDFAIMIEPVSFRGCEIIKLPFSHRMGLIVRKDHPLAQKDHVEAADLYDLPLYFSSRSNMRPEDMAAQLNIPRKHLKIAGTGNLVYNMAIMAECGVAPVFTLEGLVSAGEDSPLTFLPFEPVQERKLVFVYKQYRTFSRASRLFFDAVMNGIGM